MFSLFGGTKNVVRDRVSGDMVTKLRLKFDPYYHTVSAVEGLKVQVDGRELLMMSSNEYLGLSQHPRVIAGAQAAALKWGTSSCGSRLANGSRDYHTELEEALAAFVGKEACHITVAGYMACAGSLAGLAQPRDALIVDKSIHAALWDGALLSKADIERFTHNDVHSLRALLTQLPASQPKIIAVDGVYSMEGHLAPVPAMVDLAEEYGAVMIVDDAHGFGVFGPQGRGVCAHFGVTDRVDLIVGSFSKALASAGGFIAGSKAMIEYLRSHCRQVIFSAAITPMAAGAAHAALQVMQEEPQHRERLLANADYLRGLLQAMGVDYWESPTPAIPIVIGNKEKAYFVWKALWEAGFFTVMSISPGVPEGKDLVRCAVSALHTREQLDRFAEALKRAFKKAGVAFRG
jgi:8-amino-7-oxononanoate synthase